MTQTKKWKLVQLVAFAAIATGVVWTMVAFSDESFQQIAIGVLLGIAGFLTWIVGHLGEWWSRD